MPEEIEAEIEGFEIEDKVGPLISMGLIIPTRPMGQVPKGKIVKMFYQIRASDTDPTIDVVNMYDTPTNGPESPFPIILSPSQMTIPVNTWTPVYWIVSPPLDAPEGHFNFAGRSCSGVSGGIGLCVKANQSMEVVPTADVPQLRIIKGTYDASGTPFTTPTFPLTVDEGVRTPFGGCKIHNNSDQNVTLILGFLDKDTNEFSDSGHFNFQPWQAMGFTFTGTFYGIGTKNFQLQTRIDSQVLDTYDFSFEITNPQFGYLEVHAFSDNKELLLPVTINPGDILKYTPFWTALLPGNYHLIADAGGGNIEEKDIEIILGEQVNVNFQFGAIPNKGSLQVKAFMDSTELIIPVFITPGNNTYNTPFKIDLDPGNYHLRADRSGKIKEKDAKVESGKQTDVNFQFGTAPPPPPLAKLSVALPLVAGASLMMGFK